MSFSAQHPNVSLWGRGCAEWWKKGLHPEDELPPGFCQCHPCITHIPGPHSGAGQELLTLPWNLAVGSCCHVASSACEHLTHATSPPDFQSFFLHWKMKAGVGGV